MILSDTDLLPLIESGDIGIYPPIDREIQLQPASIDFRLGADFRLFRALGVSCFDPRDS